MENQLAEVRINQFYLPIKGSEEMQKMHEIVLLTAKPEYIMTQASTIVHQLTVESLRFTVSEKNFDIFIAQLQQLRGAKPEELTTNPE